MTGPFARSAVLVIVFTTTACDSARKECDVGCNNAFALEAREGEAAPEPQATCGDRCMKNKYDTEVRRCLREARTSYRAQVCMMTGNARKDRAGNKGPVEGNADERPPSSGPAAPTASVVAQNDAAQCERACFARRLRALEDAGRNPNTEPGGAALVQSGCHQECSR